MKTQLVRSVVKRRLIIMKEITIIVAMHSWVATYILIFRSNIKSFFKVYTLINQIMINQHIYYGDEIGCLLCKTKTI